MKNLFWHVYQNLEKELLEIGDTVLVVDNQLDVYSVRIAELLVRTCVEIESIAKELYFANGGLKSREQHPYFDRDCLGYLNEKWLLSKKKVFLSCATFFIKDEAMLEMIPLEKGNHFKTDISEWMDAYQSVKHDRMNNIKKGNIRYLIQAMAALFLLNVYMKDQIVTLGKDINGENVDWGLGSKVFSVKCHPGDGSLGKEFCYRKLEDFNECVYLSKKTDKSYEAARDEFNKMNDKMAKIAAEQLPAYIVEKINNGELPYEEINQEKIDGLIQQKQIEIIKNVYRENGKAFENAFRGIEYEGVLNKNQY